MAVTIFSAVKYIFGCENIFGSEICFQQWNIFSTINEIYFRQWLYIFGSEIYFRQSVEYVFSSEIYIFSYLKTIWAIQWWYQNMYYRMHERWVIALTKRHKHARHWLSVSAALQLTQSYILIMETFFWVCDKAWAANSFSYSYILYINVNLSILAQRNPPPPPPPLSTLGEFKCQTVSNGYEKNSILYSKCI